MSTVVDDACRVMQDASKEISRLRRERDALVAALREISALDGAYCGVAVELARAALAAAQEK